MIFLTRRATFSASHYYWNDAWPAEKNEQVFGRCANRNGHGHNYTLEVTVEGRALVLGLLTDRVFEVTPLDGDSVEAPPDIGVRWRSDYIKGVGRRGKDFVVVFDLSRLFSCDEVAAILPSVAA